MMHHSLPIYLDYAATTPVDPGVAACMMQYLTRDHKFGNPSSLHAYGRAASAGVELAREQVAALIEADPSEIIWTSGATESDNLAIKGVARLYRHKGQHIVTMKSEHKAVLDSCQALEKEGYQVTYLSPESNGLLSLDKLSAALRADTILVSIMHVNNETGIVQDLAAIAEITGEREIFLHVDAAQSPGKARLSVRRLPVDLVSLCAHKSYGPKGIGALYLRKKPRVRVEPFIHGGGHQQGMRSGTLAAHQIVGMGEALQLASHSYDEEMHRITALRNQFLRKLQSVKQLQINGDSEYGVPHILNVRFNGMLAEAIMNAAPTIACSTASACLGKGTGSSVLRSMGLTDEEANSSIRFSFGRFTTVDEIDEAAKSLLRVFGI